jgi:hypothetical protein
MNHYLFSNLPPLVGEEQSPELINRKNNRLKIIEKLAITISNELR